MKRAIRLGVTCVLLVCAYAGMVMSTPQGAKQPLTATKLLALVAGNALPENIVAAIESRGLAFKPTEEYRTQLTQAGATAEILRTVNKAVVRTGTVEEDAKQEAARWQHLSMAGKLIREKKYEEAEKQLNAMMQAGGAKLEAGFVMGEALRQQEQWEMASAVYGEIVRQDESFPEAQTKLSFVLYRAGEEDSSLRTAKAALAVTPNNAEAHKNAGLALESMRKFDAAVEEYREALRLKPDYEMVHFDLGILLYDKNDFDGAIAEYKMALALDQKLVDARINLALAYGQKRDGDGAIRELREAKKLAPKNLQVRQNLGSMLIHENLNADAVTELRELEAMAPESAVCHVCLGSALYKTQDYAAAAKEYQTAIRLEPGEAMGYDGLGRTYEAQGKYQLALKQYRLAQERNSDSIEAHVGIARVLMQTNQAALAVEELKAAKEAEPGNAEVHHQYGKALEALGNVEQAKSEYKESLLLDGQNEFTLVDLAGLLEKQGDWAGAMANYFTAMKKVEAAMMSGRAPQIILDARGAYQAAQLRFNQHLADLRAAGKSREAEKLQEQIEGTKTGQGISGQLDAAMEAGAEAFRERRYDDAERSYKEAVKLGLSLKPHEDRLVMSLGFLGALYFNRKDYADAQATAEQQLKVAEEVYGVGSPRICPTLEILARMALEQGDFARAEFFAQENLAISEKNAGDDSFSYSKSLMTLGYAYSVEKKYEKAEPYFEKAVKIHEQMTGPQGIMVVGSKRLLCATYDSLGQSAKAESCNQQLLTLMEKFYGANSPALAPILASESKALRELGRNAEADDVDRRMPCNLLRVQTRRKWQLQISGLRESHCWNLRYKSAQTHRLREPSGKCFSAGLRLIADGSAVFGRVDLVIAVY
jgi:tetratricopeptide (TPR) repeat protein